MSEERDAGHPQLGGLIAFGNSSFELGGNVFDALRAIGS